MIQKIDKSNVLGNGPITILYPGTAVSKEDTGIGSIGRIDYADFVRNTTIKMHPHINDEIVSYFRSGISEHRDSEGIVENISKNKLMLMKAGKSFYHEEKISGAEEPLQGLQIFIRPGVKDLEPKVVFKDLENIHSENEWRLLASPTTETEFEFSSQSWLYDMKLLGNNTTALPELARAGLTCLLYVFKGQVTVNDSIPMEKKDSLLIKDEPVTIKADTDAELVLFVTDENAEIFKEGMYSGNQFKL